MVFTQSAGPTLGVELELALVDEQSMGLSSCVDQIISRVPEAMAGRIKPEIMQCYLEINTDVCRTVGDAEADLMEKIRVVEGITDELGVRLLWTGTHPFSLWQDQLLTPDARYQRLREMLQDVSRRMVCFGLHVHVGVDSGDKAIMICDRILKHLPMLLALSCNSPWWNNRDTGLQSQRIKVLEMLPTAGLPTVMRNWSEYVWLINHLVDTGFIGSIRDIWWDVRPHHNFGTVEVRMCDLPGNLHDTLGLVALIQCLVHALSEEIDRGTYQRDHHPMMVRQNKWRATRYGLDAQLVDSFTFELCPARDVARKLVGTLQKSAEQLECESYLRRVLDLADGPTWAERQLKLFRETGDWVEVLRRLSSASRLTDAPPARGR